MSSDFNGTVTVRGGGIIMKDSGQFTGVTSVTLNYGGLFLENQFSLSDVHNRINPAAAVTMRGSVYEIRGFSGGTSNSATNITQSIASLTVDAGANYLGNLAGQSGSSDMVIGTFSRTPGATVDFRGNNLGRYTANAQANDSGNQDSRIIINGGLPATALSVEPARRSPMGSSAAGRS